MEAENSLKAEKREIRLVEGDCPVHNTLAVIGGRWKISILYALTLKPVYRFGELRRAVVGVSQKMLTQQLRELEADGLVTRKVYAEVPPRVEYRLTQLGKSIQPVMDSLADWGKKLT